MRRAFFLALATASVATISMAAVTLAAAAPDAGRAADHITVRFSDLNLASRAGARALVSRIRSAANELCGPELVGDLGRMADRAECVRATQARAIQAVDRPTVTAAYLELPQSKVVALANRAR